MHLAQPKTIIVGGGLAGLTCAKVLAERGASFVLCEAGMHPGGRVVSQETSEGLILDRGFQVLLDSYPCARRHLHLKSLGGGRFRAGALFVGLGKPQALENPLSNPAALLRAMPQQLIPLRDLLRLASLVLESFGPHENDISTSSLLARRGFSERFMNNFACPFFGGVLLDPKLETSSALLLGYLRRFATGRALLPEKGIGAIGEQLAGRLPAGAMRYGASVGKVLFHDGKPVGVRLQSGEILHGNKIVLATDEPTLCKLLGRGTPRPARSTAVHYFVSSRPLYKGAWLCLPPRCEDKAVLHAALLTNVTPTLAPPGVHLWSVTVADGHPKADDAEWVAGEVSGWFDAHYTELKPVEYVTVPYAVPEQLPGFMHQAPPWGKLPPGIYAAGDAVASASIDAAMASGESAAKKVISSAVSN